MCLYGRAGLFGVLSRASLLACCAVVRSDPIRCGGGDELCRKETGFSRWQDYDDQLNCHRPCPATALVRPSHTVITLSLPLCYAIPDPPAVSGFSLSLSLLAKPIILYLVLPSFPHSSAFKNTVAVPHFSDGNDMEICCHENVLLPYSYLTIVISGLCPIQN